MRHGNAQTLSEAHPVPTVDAALGVGNDHERFPVGIEKYLTLRYYTLLHNELYGVCENDP